MGLPSGFGKNESVASYDWTLDGCAVTGRDWGSRVHPVFSWCGSALVHAGYGIEAYGRPIPCVVV